MIITALVASFWQLRVVGSWSASALGVRGNLEICNPEKLPTCASPGTAPLRPRVALSWDGRGAPRGTLVVINSGHWQIAEFGQ